MGLHPFFKAIEAVLFSSHRPQLFDELPSKLTTIGEPMVGSTSVTRSCFIDSSLVHRVKVLVIVDIPVSLRGWNGLVKEL